MHVDHVLLLVVHSPFDRVLYVKPGVCKFQTSFITRLSMLCDSENHCPSFSFGAVHHRGRRGVIPARGKSLPP